MAYHDLQSSNMLDVRRVRGPTISDDQVLYAVHQVTVGNAKWFHHSMMLGDGMDALASGLLTVQESIRGEIGRAGEILPVMIRSLMISDQAEVGDALDRISEEVQTLRSAGRHSGYVVLGMVGEKELTLFSVDAKDAFYAASSAAELVAEQHGQEFVPLSVSFVQDSLDELNLSFGKRAKEVRLVLSASPATKH